MSVNRTLTNKFNIHDNYSLTEEDKRLFKRQENLCYICSCELDLDTEDIMKTPCDHLYHYDCLYYTICANKLDRNKKRNPKSVLECPYCRSYLNSYLPMFKIGEYKLINGININKHEPLLCNAVLKSGNRKGETCGCVIRNTIESGNILCGRHRKNKIKIDKYYSEKGCFISM